jgi:hypothetical protein
MRLTVFVTLFSISALAQMGLNGQISAQSGFTRTQIERAIDPPTQETTPPGINPAPVPNPAPTPVVIVNSNSRGSCFKTACKMAGEFGCDDQTEVIGMNQVCRTQASDECLVDTCQSLGQFACDEFNEIRRVLVTNCGADDTLKPSEQRVQDSTARQRLSDF